MASWINWARKVTMDSLSIVWLLTLFVAGALAQNTDAGKNGKMSIL
jgi:hypothetical protein